MEVSTEVKQAEEVDAASFNKSYDKFISQAGQDNSEISKNLVKKEKWNEHVW